MRIFNHTVQDEDEEAEPATVQAIPLTQEHPYGRCNPVLVYNDESAEDTGLEGRT